MSKSLSRREALKRFVRLIGAVGALRAAADSGAATPMLVPLSPSASDALALGYHEDVATIRGNFRRISSVKLVATACKGVARTVIGITAICFAANS